MSQISKKMLTTAAGTVPLFMNSYPLRRYCKTNVRELREYTFSKCLYFLDLALNAWVRRFRARGTTAGYSNFHWNQIYLTTVRQHWLTEHLNPPKYATRINMDVSYDWASKSTRFATRTQLATIQIALIINNKSLIISSCILALLNFVLAVRRRAYLFLQRS